MDSNKKPSWQRDLAYFIFVHPPAIIGIFLFTICVGAVLELVLNGGVVDRIFVKPPFYPVQIALGSEIGFLLNRRLRSKSACFAWIIGLIPFWMDYRGFLQPGGIHAVLDFLSGAHCGTCLEELFSIATFQLSLAYSIGSLAALKWATWRSDHKSQPAATSSAAGTKPSTSEESELS